MLKTAIYTRVSTDKEEQKLSFKGQAEYYSKYCKEKGYDLYAIYADEGITGTKKNRKEFINMMIDAGLDIQKDEDGMITGFKASKREPKFNYILMKDITRFSRNTNVIDTVRALVDKNVYLIFEDMNLTTDKKNWELEFNLYLTFSQQESLDKSNKIRWAYERRKESGKWHMSTPLFGYKYNKEKDEYEVIDEEAIWVRKAFDMYINDLEGTKNIATFLNSNKVKTRRNKEWRSDSVKRLLTNEKYTGKVIIGKYQNGEVTSETKTKKKVDDENKWNVIENGIAPIIDEETFNNAQEILKNRVKQMADGSKIGSKKVKSVFHQKLKCSKCGSFFTRVKGTKEKKDGTKIHQFNYFCLNRRTLKSCDMRGVSHDVLTRELQKMIDTGLIRNLILKSADSNDSGKETNLFKEALKRIDEQRLDAETKVLEIQNQINEIENKIDVLYGIISKSGTSEIMIEKTTEKIEQLAIEQKDLELKKLEFSSSSLDQKEKFIRDYYKSMVQLSSKKTYTLEEIIKWIDVIEVHENRELHFYFKFPSIHRLRIEDSLLPEESNLVRTRFDVKY